MMAHVRDECFCCEKKLTAVILPYFYLRFVKYLLQLFKYLQGKLQHTDQLLFHCVEESIQCRWLRSSCRLSTGGAQPKARGCEATIPQHNKGPGTHGPARGGTLKRYRLEPVTPRLWVQPGEGHFGMWQEPVTPRLSCKGVKAQAFLCSGSLL